MANKGNYYKVKTKRWFEADGYLVEYLEKLQHIFSKGKVIYIKRDLLGADGLALNDSEFILWNSITNKGDIARHLKRFGEYPCPKFIKRYLVLWTPRCHEPEIIEFT